MFNSLLRVRVFYTWLVTNMLFLRGWEAYPEK